LKSILASLPCFFSSHDQLTQMQVQEAADCLGADCVPRCVEMKQIQELDVRDILQLSNKARYEANLLAYYDYSE
jgi:probable phosphoglycerate mutase